MGFLEIVGELCGVPCHRVRVYRTQRIFCGHGQKQILSFSFERATASKNFRPATMNLNSKSFESGFQTPLPMNELSQGSTRVLCSDKLPNMKRAFNEEEEDIIS